MAKRSTNKSRRAKATPSRSKSRAKATPTPRSKSPKAIESKPPEHKQRAVEARTEDRRLRVLQLWGKKDPHVARILLEEGFEVDCGEAPLTAANRLAWEIRRISSMRRNVWNDREYWRERFREKAKAPKSGTDLAVEREEYVLSLRTDLDDIDDILVHKGTKSTAKGILIGEKRQTRQAIAKAQGIDQASEIDLRAGETPQRAKVLILDLSKCDEETKAIALASSTTESAGGRSRQPS